MSELEETKYGFKWGPLIVERDASDPKGGYVLSVYTGQHCIDIRATPKGHGLEATHRQPNKYQLEQWNLIQGRS